MQNADDLTLLQTFDFDCGYSEALCGLVKDMQATCVIELEMISFACETLYSKKTEY